MDPSILLSIVGCFLCLILGLVVLSKNRKEKVNKIFFLLSLIVTIWIFNSVWVDMIGNYEIALILTKLALIWAIFIPILLHRLIINLYFNKQPQNIHNKILNVWVIILLLISSIFNQTSFNIKSLEINSWGIEYQPGILYYLLLIHYILFCSISINYLLKTYRSGIEPMKSQSILIMWGCSLTILFGVVTNIIMPILGHGDLSRFGPPTIFIFLLFTAYAITKHHLFNIKIIAIELVTLVLWIFLLLRLLASQNTTEIIVNANLLGITIIFGILLIRSTMQDIRQREKIDKLTEELKGVYDKVKELNAESYK